jgi:hypothetical protein
VHELEQALLTRWDRETLLVYADVLLSAGDPRGELIVLDLEAEERGMTPELAQRRRKALYEWLGGATIRGRPVHEASFRYGFATDFFATGDHTSQATDYLDALFDSAAGPYVRGVTVSVGNPSDLGAAFMALAREPHPWLERLEFRVVEPGPWVTDAQVAALIASTPRLHTLAVFGAHAVGAFRHPSVRKLVTDTPRLAIAHTIPHVEALDLGIDEDDREDNESGFDAAIPASLAAITELRHLDLSRNEPHYPPSRDPAMPLNVDVYPLLRWLPTSRLRTLRMPSLRAPHQVALLGEAIDLAPALEVTIARTYEMHQAVLETVAHARLHLPTPFAWLPGDTLSSREALTITVPTEEYGDDLSLTSLIDRLEAQWSEMPPNARTAWLEFWDFLADLPWEDQAGHDVMKMFPAATLLTAVEPLDDYIPYSGASGTWAQLAEKLRSAELPEGTNVSVRRYWGW